MNIDFTIQIETSPVALWELLTDRDRLDEWAPGVVSIEPTTPGPMGTGMISRVRIQEGRKVVDYVEEILAYEPSSHLEVELREGSLGGSPMRVGWRLAESAGATSLRYTARWQPRGLLMNLMAPVIGIFGRRNARSAMGKLRELAESAA